MPIDAPCVIRLLAEGSCIEIFGRQEPDGSWWFIGQGLNLGIEDDGNDTVLVDGIPRCRNLATALPDDLWIRFVPMHVHPALRGWFRDRYDATVAALPAHHREMHGGYRDGKWREMFDSTPPDRWSTEEPA